jgi:hypothetical protein
MLSVLGATVRRDAANVLGMIASMPATATADALNFRGNWRVRGEISFEVRRDECMRSFFLSGG